MPCSNRDYPEALKAGVAAKGDRYSVMGFRNDEPLFFAYDSRPHSPVRNSSAEMNLVRLKIPGPEPCRDHARSPKGRIGTFDNGDSGPPVGLKVVRAESEGHRRIMLEIERHAPGCSGTRTVFFRFSPSGPEKVYFFSISDLEAKGARAPTGVRMDEAQLTRADAIAVKCNHEHPSTGTRYPINVRYMRDSGRVSTTSNECAFRWRTEKSAVPLAEFLATASKKP